MRTMKSQEFKIYENSKWFDSVWYDGDMTTQEVKRSLINHDGYSSSIQVERTKDQLPV